MKTILSLILVITLTVVYSHIPSKSLSLYKGQRPNTLVVAGNEDLTNNIILQRHKYDVFYLSILNALPFFKVMIVPSSVIDFKTSIKESNTVSDDLAYCILLSLQNRNELLPTKTTLYDLSSQVEKATFKLSDINASDLSSENLNKIYRYVLNSKQLQSCELAIDTHAKIDNRYLYVYCIDNSIAYVIDPKNPKAFNYIKNDKYNNQQVIGYYYLQ